MAGATRAAATALAALAKAPARLLARRAVSGATMGRRIRPDRGSGPANIRWSDRAAVTGRMPGPGTAVADDTRVPDAVQPREMQSIAGQRCSAEPGAMHHRKLVSPGSAAHHAAGAARCTASGAQAQCRPPVTCSVSPATEAAASEEKNATGGPISAPLPTRPSGVVASIHLRMSLSCRPAVTTPSVTIMPGLTVLTRIFFGASSFDRVEEIASTEALVAV